MGYLKRPVQSMTCKVSPRSNRHTDRACLLSGGKNGRGMMSDVSKLCAGGSKPATLETGATVNVSASLLHVPEAQR